MKAPSAQLAGRYRFKSPAQVNLKAPTWLATDEQSGTEVVASALPTARVAALMGVVGLKHPNLAAIIQVVDTPDPASLPEGTPEGAAVVVAEHVPGRTLHQYLKTTRMTPAEAVTLWLRLCRALGTLHASGGAHGAISPRSILVEASGSRDVPVLTQLLAATSGAYCAPERLQGRGPSSSDDTWALHATLFAALTGSSPYRGETKDDLLQSIVSGQVLRLAEFGVTDESLQDLLQAGLVANLARRRTTVDQLVEALETWEPAPLSAAASEWEEDAATVVGDDSEAMAAMMRSDASRPKPGESLPPVPVGEDDDEPTMAEERHKRPHPPRAGKPPRPVAPKAPVAPAPAPAAPPPRAPKAAPPAAPRAAPPAPQPEPAWPAPEPVQKTQPLATEPLATEPLAEPPFQPEPEPEPAAPVEPPPYEPNPYDDEDDATTVMGGEPLADIRRVLAADSDVPPAAPAPPLPAAGTPPGYPQTPYDVTPPPPPGPWGAPAAQAPAPAPAPNQGFPPPEGMVEQGPYLPSIPAPPTDFQLPPGALDDLQIRKASRGPMIALVAIVVVLIILISILLILNYQGVIVTGPFTPERVASVGPSSVSRSATPARAGASSAPKALASTLPSASAPPPAFEVPENRGRCVANHFEGDTLSGSEDFAFLCQDKDLRGVTSQLHRRIVVAGAGKITPGMREWANLGWFELAVTATIRSGCCPPGTAQVSLPRTAEGCEQLAAALARVARRPVSKGDGPARAKEFDDAVVCYFKNGIERPYNYLTRPTPQGRAAFAAFVDRVAARA